MLCAYGIPPGETRRTGLRDGLAARLLRPISLVPFPTAPIAALAGKARRCLVVELSLGQFCDDVRLAVEGRCPVELLAHTGGVMCTPEEVLDTIVRLSEAK